jgi:hypothetical protein
MKVCIKHLYCTGGSTMYSHLTAALERIKKNVAAALSAQGIEQVCRETEHVWRERELGPAQTIWAFLLQVLHGNTACRHVLRIAQLSCSATAYCDARARLSLAVYERLLQQTTNAARTSTVAPLWHGHRTLVIDGTGISMPDTKELHDHFGAQGQQAPGCSFPIAHLLALFDSATGLLVQAWAGPLRTHDMKDAAKLHPALQDGDVLVGDTAFASYAHLALLSRQKLHGVFRRHQRQLASFRQDRRLAGKLPQGTKATHAKSRLIRKLGRFDQVVEYGRANYSQPHWISAEDWRALPETLHVRELHYWPKQRGFRTREVTLVTTLIAAEHYPLEDLADLYGRRWGVETNFSYLKTTMKMDVLRCKTVAGVQKELMIFAIVYNLIRLVMLAAAVRQGVPLARVSFIDALRWLGEACWHRPTLELVLNPDRRGRYEPRVKKRRAKEFTLMNLPRKELRKQLVSKKVTA